MVVKGVDFNVAAEVIVLVVLPVTLLPVALAVEEVRELQSPVIGVLSLVLSPVLAGIRL